MDNEELKTLRLQMGRPPTIVHTKRELALRAYASRQVKAENRRLRKAIASLKERVNRPA